MATLQQLRALLDGPAMAPPPAVEPNFVSPKNHFVYFVLTIVLTVTISTLALLVRIYTKFFIIRKVGWEDYTMILGYFMWIGYCVPTSLIMETGGGVHQWNVQLKNFISLLYYSNIAAIMYGITMFIIKLSILLQYMKIFTPAQKSNVMYWGIHTVIWLNFAFYFAITFGEIFLCNPREKYWNVLITTGHCSNANAANIAAGSFNSFSDFVVLLLPQRVIWKLQMPLKRKLGVSAIFLTGLFVCITSVLRLYYSVRLAQTGDVTYNIAFMGFWTYAELSMGVFCGCLPVTPKFFQMVGQKLSTMTGSGSSLRTVLGRSTFGRRSTKQSQEVDDAMQTWKIPYAEQRHLGDDYKTLDEHEMQEMGGFNEHV